MDVSIIIPVFNAATFVAARLGGFAEFLGEQTFTWELIVVDDGSSDQTADLIRALDLPHCRVVESPENSGKFGAIARGVTESSGRCVLFTDADAPYDPRAVTYMASLILGQGFQVVLGDRTLEDSTYGEKTGWLRRLTGKAFTYYIRLLVTGGIYDTQCGIKAFQGDIARQLFPLLRELRFTGDVELVYLALKYNLAIRRIPVLLVHHGPSSIRMLRDGLSMISASLRIRSRYRRGVYACPELRDLASQRYWDGPESHA